MDATFFAMTACRIRWEAIDAMRALNLPEPKKPAEVVSIEQARRKRWLAKYARPMKPHGGPDAAA